LAVESGFVTTAFGRFHYDAVGEGKPVLFIHGGTASAREWRWVLPALGKHARCVAIDRLGCGQSDHSRLGYDRTTLTNSLLACADELGLTRFGVVGQSFGGLWALSLAFTAPQRVSRLILVDSAVGPRTEDELAERQAHPPSFQLLKPWYQMSAEEREANLDNVFARIFADPSRVDPTFREDLRWQNDRMDRNQPRLGGELFEGIARQRYDSIRCRTLIVWGEADSMDPVRYGHRLAAAIPHARFVGLPGVGHTCQIEDPERFVASVAPFLDETDAIG
jgi:pimeloyl-ACP methyl ester carboxylesterase